MLVRPSELTVLKDYLKDPLINASKLCTEPRQLIWETAT